MRVRHAWRMGKRSRRERRNTRNGGDLSGAVRAALTALRTPAYDRAVDVLAQHGPVAVAAAVAELRAALQAAAERGWAPPDLEHVVARELSAEHAAVAGGHPLPAATAVAAAIRLIVETLELILRLPPEYAGSGRTVFTPAGSGGMDERMLKRVRALLAKAESTEFPEEAEALSAKAQELIARHALDALLVHPEHDDQGPAWRRVYLDDPYVDAKAMILGGVAAANRCTVVYSPTFAWCTVFGFAADLDAVELLNASLLAQASRAMVRAGSLVDARGRSRTRSFRRAFLVGFAERIAQRLRETTQAQVDAIGRGSLLPALAARDERVEALRQQAFPRTVQRPTRISNAGGLVAGRAAADVADLSMGAGAIDRRSG